MATTTKTSNQNARDARLHSYSIFFVPVPQSLIPCTRYNWWSKTWTYYRFTDDTGGFPWAAAPENVNMCLWAVVCNMELILLPFSSSLIAPRRADFQWAVKRSMCCSSVVANNFIFYQTMNSILTSARHSQSKYYSWFNTISTTSAASAAPLLIQPVQIDGQMLMIVILGLSQRQAVCQHQRIFTNLNAMPHLFHS